MCTVNVYEVALGIRGHFRVVDSSPLFCRHYLLTVHCCAHILVTINLKNIASLLVDYQSPVDRGWAVK